MMEFVNGKDDIPYMMENSKNVWNHQPDGNITIFIQQQNLTHPKDVRFGGF
jgi:hypothetical protein